MTGRPFFRRSLFGVAATVALARSVPSFAADQSVIAPIRDLVAGLLRIMKAGQSTPFDQRYATLAPIIDRAFDLGVVLQESVGLAWSNLSPDDQTMLRKDFRRYTIASYVNSFDNFTGQQFVVQPDTRAVANGQQVVMTKIIPASAGGRWMCSPTARSAGSRCSARTSAACCPPAARRRWRRA